VEKKDMQTTTLKAYEILRPDINRRQSQVMLVLRLLGQACNYELSQYLKLPINVVTPRILELRQQGRVIEAGRRRSPTGRQAIYWKIAEQQELLFD
jgi:hypothetical protein